MAVYRIPPQCPKCGKAYDGVYRPNNGDFLGDDFIKWDIEGHICRSNNALKTQEMEINQKELSKLSITDLRNLNEFIALNIYTTKSIVCEDSKKACRDAIKAEMNKRVEILFPGIVLQ